MRIGICGGRRWGAKHPAHLIFAGPIARRRGMIANLLTRAERRAFATHLHPDIVMFAVAVRRRRFDAQDVMAGEFRCDSRERIFRIGNT